MSYNVVFEINETYGGLYGCRNTIQYPNKSIFESKKTEGEIIVAEGITEEEVHKLIVVTPEVCRLMGVIEQAFNDNPHISPKELRIRISTVKQYVILHDREDILALGLERIDATKYIAHYRQMLKNDPDSMKTAAMAGILSVLADEYTGEVL